MTTEISKIDLRRHHRRARLASIEDFEKLGIEHAQEDARNCYATLSRYHCSGTLTIVQAAQAERMRKRAENFRAAGVSEDRIEAWDRAHVKEFASRLEDLKKRGV